MLAVYLRVFLLKDYQSNCPKLTKQNTHPCTASIPLPLLLPTAYYIIHTAYNLRLLLLLTFQFSFTTTTTTTTSTISCSCSCDSSSSSDGPSAGLLVHSSTYQSTTASRSPKPFKAPT